MIALKESRPLLGGTKSEINPTNSAGKPERMIRFSGTNIIRQKVLL